jgi:hypothetical protein
MNLFFTLNSSLKYENVQKEIPLLVNELTNGSSSLLQKFDLGDAFNISQATDKEKTAMDKYCQNNSEYTFVFEGSTISVPCSSLSGGKEAVVKATVNGFVDSIYYKEYDCNFWNCITKEKAPYFLISQKAKDYWHQKFYFALIASLVLVALLFLLVEGKTNWPVLVGSILILSAAPLLKIKEIISFIIPKSIHILSVFLSIFFSKSYATFWISLIVGLVLIGLGLGLKFSNAEFVKNILDKIEKKESAGKVAEKKTVEKKTKKNEAKKK